MSGIITLGTSIAIARCHQEIDASRKLLEELRGKGIGGDGDVPDLRDAFGRLRTMTLGVPFGERSGGREIKYIDPGLATAIITAHIQSVQGKLAGFCELARFELDASPADSPASPNDEGGE